MNRPTRPDRLEPSERALAEALAQAPSASGPPAGLDAAILAAARKAAEERGGEGAPAAGRPPSSKAGQGHRRRSPAWLRGGALAASVVLAVGVAWQLRPQFDMAGLGDAAPVATQSPVPAVDVADAPAGERLPKAPAPAQPLPAPAAESGPDAPQAEGASAPTPAAAGTATQADGPAPEQPPREPPAAREATGALDKAMPERAAQTSRAAGQDASSPETTLASPPPPPAPPAPPAPSPPRALQAQPPAKPATGPEAGIRARVRDVQRLAVPVDAESTHDEDWLDQPMDDTPPASVDSPAVREAWLARIRELVAAERYGEARESYAEFRRRHPGAVVPDDLRALLGEE